MKIAVMTVFCNEKFRLQNWKSYYLEYKDDIDLHVIINNGSVDDTELLQETFPESTVLTCKTKNLLAAYNIGLNYIFQDKNVDAIMQITNDVRFASGAIKKLYFELFANNNVAVVGPVLFSKDSYTIESYGWVLCEKFGFGKPLYIGKHKNFLETVDNTEVSFIPAGVIMVKRSVWEKLGLQDETLFMYADERDFAIRLKKMGYSEVVIPTAYAWHQHQNKPGTTTRGLYSIYFSSRNQIYITRKHFGLYYAIIEYSINMIYMFMLICYHIIRVRFSHLKCDNERIKGLTAGIMNNMNNKIV